MPPRHTWKLVDMCDDSYDAVEDYYFNKSVAVISGQENWNKQLATQVYSRSLQPEILPTLKPLSCNKERANAGKRVSEEEQINGKRKRKD